jgi:GxxExxY protein
MDGEQTLTERIITCAIAVHRELGPGLLENAYEAALAIELATTGLKYDRQVLRPMHYRGSRIGDYRIDLIVESQVIVEIKSVVRHDPVFTAQVLTYLRVTGLQVGLLLNFGRPSLVDGIKRIVLTR